MAKQLNVNLTFNADTSKAKAQMQDLQRTLDTLVKGSAHGISQSGLPLTKNLMEAQVAATKLQTILSQSMNQKTGNLDLTRFSESFNKAGMDLQKLKTQLELLGPTGQKAFMSLASSIVSADVPLRRTNLLISELWTTMKNTVRWQLSSSVLHGFMGTIQSATSYARDLDKSLNNIRIVTEKSTDEMAVFADNANKAAKALSATTTQYTDASLIYYQQGLNDTEVQQRTDVTIKMAHAAGQSAEVVSDQLTAIWNNFYDGSKSLEYYADVMTALGAATASSTDEIAGGLEKFASIAEMIGLSYEYAASALATITATTRQSEEVVGTALKTIFARIQGLSLGETLDDGTTLNKYSEALMKVGISIKDQNGELKNMDSILNEMGAKWDTLNKDQQVALAQTVAGVRQYNQLVSLMDNWDFFEQNLNIAYGSTGTLEEQAEIYAESWQAARDRVKAAAQDIYDSILDPKFFINLLDGFEDVLSMIATFTDSIGGLEGVFAGLGVVITRVFSSQLTDAIERMAFNFRSMTGETQRAADAMQNLAVSEVNKMQFNTGTEFGDAEATALRRRLQLQNEIKTVSQNLTQKQRKQLSYLLKINDAYAEQAIKVAQAKDIASDKVQEEDLSLRKKASRSSLDGGGESAMKIYKEARSEMKEMASYGATASEALNKVHTELSNPKGAQKFGTNIMKVVNHLKAIDRPDAAKSVQRLYAQFKSGAINAKDFSQALRNIVTEEELLSDTAIKASDNFRHKTNGLIGTRTEVDNLANSEVRLAREALNSNKANEASKKIYDELKSSIQGFQGAMSGFGQSVVKAMQGVSQISMGITSLKSAWNALNNEDMSFGEKFLQITMSLSMAIPSLIGGFQALRAAKLGEAAATVKDTLATMADSIAKIQNAGASGKAAVASSGLTASLWGQVAAWFALRTSMSPVLILFISMVGPILAVIAAAASLIGIGTAIYNEYNKAEIALDKAIKAEKELAETTKETQSILNDVLSAFDSYDKAVQALNECDKGTKEWEDSLKKVNDQIWDILQKYPELMEVSNLFNEDGTFNDEAIQSFIKDKEKNATNAQIASINASAKTSQAKVESNTVDLERKILSIVNQHSYQLDATRTENYKGKTYADLSKELVSGMVDVFNDKTLNIDDAQRRLDEYIDSFDLEGEARDEFAKEIKDNADLLRELANSVQAANNQIQHAGKLSAQQTLGEDASDKQINNWSEVFSEAKKDYDVTGINRWSQAEDPELKKLLEDAGYKDKQLSDNEVYDNNGVLTVRFADGSEASIYQLAELAATNAAKEQANQEVIYNDPIFDQFKKNGINLNENVSTDLVTSLMNQVEFNDTLIQAFQVVGNSAVEQEQLIKDILNSQTKEEKETTEIQSIKSDATSKYELDADIIEEQAERIQDAYNLTAVEATKLAVENQRMNKGVEDLSENWEDWNKTLKKGNLKKEEKLTAEYAETVNALTKTIADLVGASEDLELPDEFFDTKENLELISKAAKGSTQAINELGVAVGKSLVESMNVELEVNEEGQYLNSITVDKFNSNKEIVLSGIEELQAKVAAGTDLIGQGLNEILEGGTEGASSWINSLNEMALATNMTVDEMNSMLNALGLEADVTVTEQPVTSRKPITRTTIKNLNEVKDESGNPIGYEYDTVTSIVGYENVTENLQIAQIGTNGAEPGAADVKYIGNGSVSPNSVKSKGGGGGKTSKAEPVKYTKKSDVVERYKEQNDVLDNIEDELKDISKQSERAFGATRVAWMKKEQEALKEQHKAIKNKIALGKEYLKIDKEALKVAAKKYNLEFEFDANTGDVINQTQLMTQLYNELHAAEEAMDKLSTKEAQDKFNEETVTPIQNKIDELKDALAQYEGTKEELEDFEDLLNDTFYEWQDSNYNEMSYKLELKLEINDEHLRYLDYLMDKYSDNFFKTEEALVAMSNKIPAAEDALGKYTSYWGELNQKYEDGLISHDHYVQGLKEVRDGYYENLEALIEIDKQMLHYYEDTLADAKEELDDYTDHMGHLTEVFEHYLNLMDILGKSKDFDVMNDFLNGKAETLRDRLDVAKDYYEMLLGQKSDAEKALNKALASGDEAAIELYKKEWDAIVDAVDEAQNEMLSLTEEWAEAMKAVIENNMAKIADALEKTLTGGTTFDTIMDEFDKLNTRQEEYLTKTNQIYETNKLMRTASKALDETDNKVAKQKLKNFIDETKSLQENTQLSKYELEIQQAKYDLLLAEIALEEAQNAKSTVRLSRDNEGNFGYVYTADQDAVDDAQQKVEDAENRLYNISLEGQQDYTEKYMQTLQEMFEELTELENAYINGELASDEEYYRRKETIMAHYFGDNGILTTYSKLYNVAVRTDAEATQDNWQKEYGEMTQDTEKWHDAVQIYLKEIEDQTEEWADVSKQANKDVEKALTDSADATEELTDESEELADMIQGDLIPAIDNELDMIREQTAAYAAQRKELLELIAAHEAYITSLNSQIQTHSEAIEYDPDTDYAALIMGYMAATGATNASMSDPIIKELVRQRDLKRKALGMEDDEWGGSGSDFLKDLTASNKYYEDEDEVRKALNKLGISAFASGGYTGDWGPEGKLAVLHEKELVLNAKDTENILSAISFIKDIVSMIDTQAQMQSIFNLFASSGVAAENRTIEQTVTIHADFPNAIDRNEIAEAFNNLLNVASQYANRK